MPQTGTSPPFGTGRLGCYPTFGDPDPVDYGGPCLDCQAMRRTTAILATAAAVLVATQTASASSAHVCGVVKASVPYTPHGNANRWRVYVSGGATCHAAEAALTAVMHLKATQHVGRSEADSYFTVGGWRCPFGDMGFQTCARPGRPPYRARALAVECSINACPATRPPSYFR